MSDETTLADEVENESSLAYALLVLMGGLKLQKDWGWEIVVRHERHVYRSTITPLQPTRLIPFDTSSDSNLRDFPRTTDPITSYTAFETTLVGGLGQLPGDEELSPLVFVGVGHTRYQKPYLLREGDRYVPEFLFDARFEGFGIGVGFIRDASPTDGGPFYELRGLFGFGKVNIIEEVDIGDLIDQDKQGVGYLQGHLRVGYLFRIVADSWSLAAGADGQFTLNYFFIYEKGADSGQSGNSTLALNYDLAVGGSGRLVFGF